MHVHNLTHIHNIQIYAHIDLDICTHMHTQAQSTHTNLFSLKHTRAHTCIHNVYTRTHTTPYTHTYTQNL